MKVLNLFRVKANGSSDSVKASEDLSVNESQIDRILREQRELFMATPDEAREKWQRVLKNREDTREALRREKTADAKLRALVDTADQAEAALEAAEQQAIDATRAWGAAGAVGEPPSAMGVEFARKALHIARLQAQGAQSALNGMDLPIGRSHLAPTGTTQSYLDSKTAFEEAQKAVQPAAEAVAFAEAKAAVLGDIPKATQLLKELRMTMRRIAAVDYLYGRDFEGSDLCNRLRSALDFSDEELSRCAEPWVQRKRELLIESGMEG